MLDLKVFTTPEHAEYLADLKKKLDNFISVSCKKGNPFKIVMIADSWHS